MRFAWLEDLLPQGMLTPRNQVGWVLFFLLFPLAYWGAVTLETIEATPAMMAGYEDREASIHTARQFAESKGFPVTGWHEYVVATSNESLMAYYNSSKDPMLAEANTVAPGQEVQVLFRSPDQSHEFRTYLSLMGDVTGYDFGKSKTAKHENVSFNFGGVTTTSTTPEKQAAPNEDDSSMQNAIKLSDAEAESIARDALAKNPKLSQFIQLGKAHITTSIDDSSRHDVVWEASPAGRPELTIKASVGVRDFDVVSEHVEASLDKKHQVHSSAYQVAFIAIYSCFLTFGAIYAMFRYAKRTLQKEVSHLRTLVVMAIFTVSYSALVYSIAVDQVATRVSGPTFARVGIVLYTSSVFLFAILGLLLGIAYGSGEGEVREAYPGKLTSLDALLAGRLFSRDVGASLFFGAAAAGWLLLAQQAISFFIKTDVVATRSDVLVYTFARIPWLALLLGRQYASVLIAVTGLLLPAAFLLRRTVRKRGRFIWLLLFAVCSVLRDAARYPTLPSALVAIVILVCALLLPFFAFDLLAAMVCLSALSFVEEITRLHAVFPSWNHFAVSMGSVGGLFLVVAIYLALRGRRVDEDEVGPLYAKNLAQRMSLQAEVHAAREAQLRLLPQSAPELPGVQFAACCLPARDVGGDFYDFFRLDTHRVGIFVAQGNDQGLASALCIALAKGVLMHASLQPKTPTQTLVDLESSLEELLEGGSAGRISFAYAIMDTRRNALSYARLGESPRFVVYREGAGISASAQLESIVPVPGRPKNAPIIYEGSAQTQAGDFLIFFTKGITSLPGKRFIRGEHQWIEALMPLLGRKEDSLQMSLDLALSRHQRRATDDLTAVVLRVLQSQLLQQEVVA